VYGIAACVIGLPRNESGRGGETRGRSPKVMSRYTVVFSGSWRARVMWLQIYARSASCLEILRVKMRWWRGCICFGFLGARSVERGARRGLVSHWCQGIGVLGDSGGKCRSRRVCELARVGL
jgi:hypothetical protein